jgi:predicted nucleic acid-binding protein
LTGNLFKSTLFKEFQHPPKALNALRTVFFKKNIKTWAGRSVRYDRRVRNAEAAGSNPARSIIRFEPLRVWIPSNRFWVQIHRGPHDNLGPVSMGSNRLQDAMIAAIAVGNCLTLVTRNEAHFKRIKSLRTEAW